MDRVWWQWKNGARLYGISCEKQQGFWWWCLNPSWYVHVISFTLHQRHGYFVFRIKTSYEMNARNKNTIGPPAIAYFFFRIRKDKIVAGNDWSTAANQDGKFVYGGIATVDGTFRRYFECGSTIASICLRKCRWWEYQQGWRANTSLHWRRHGHGQAQIHGDGGCHLFQVVCRDWTSERDQWEFGCDYRSVVGGDTQDWWWLWFPGSGVVRDVQRYFQI